MIEISLVKKKLDMS